MISLHSQNNTALTIYNDRPQAAAVHYDGGLKILIDRRVLTRDEGGIPEPMWLNFSEDLYLNFRIKMHDYRDIGPEYTQKRKSLQAVSSSRFEIKENDLIYKYRFHTEELQKTLQNFNV